MSRAAERNTVQKKLNLMTNLTLAAVINQEHAVITRYNTEKGGNTLHYVNCDTEHNLFVSVERLHLNNELESRKRWKKTC